MEGKKDRINVFISSRHDEFRDVRESIGKILKELPISVPINVSDISDIHLGESIENTIYQKIGWSDIIMMLIGDSYSKWVNQEYITARALNKPLFIFIQEALEKKPQEVNNFLRSTNYATSFWFKSDEELTDLIKRRFVKYITENYLRFDIVPSDLNDSSAKEVLKQEIKKTEPDDKLCFVIMPIGKEDSKKYKYFKAIYDNIIVPAIEIDKDGNRTGLKCERADQAHNTGSITKDIIEKLNAAEIVVADLTGTNPNVFYELGVRHTIRQKTIMITQSFKDLPFDIASYRTIRYNPTVGIAEEAIAELRFVVQTLIRSRDIKDSPVRDWIPI